MTGRIGRMKVRNKRYFDGVESYQRVSTALKNIETDTFYLDEWDRNMHVIGMAMRPDLVLGVAAAAQYDPVTGKLTSEAKSTLRGLRYQALEAAKTKAGANAGTAVHTATERLDMGESVEQIALPYPYNADLRAYETLVRTMGLRFRPEHIERTVRLSGFGIAGTFDRFGTSELLVERGFLEPDELLVVDVKTEQDPLLNLIHIAPQLAGYANADDMFIPEPTEENEYAGRYEPLPNVSKIVGLVIHIRAGRAVPYLIDLSAGWSAMRAAYEQRERMRESKIKLGEPGCWAVALPIDILPAAELAADAHARGPLGFSAPAGTTREQFIAGAAPVAAIGTVEQSYQRADGMVDWQRIPDGQQPLEAMLWEAIMSADTLDELAALYDRAGATGVEWSGPIADAGTLRAAIIACVQRELHVAANGGACACGWKAGLAP